MEAKQFDPDIAPAAQIQPETDPHQPCEPTSQQNAKSKSQALKADKKDTAQKSDDERSNELDSSGVADEDQSEGEEDDTAKIIASQLAAETPLPPDVKSERDEESTLTNALKSSSLEPPTMMQIGGQAQLAAPSMMDIERPASRGEETKIADGNTDQNQTKDHPQESAPSRQTNKEDFVFDNGIPVDNAQPQHNTWNLPGGVVVSSAFDSGNLGRCYPDEDGEPDTFTCYMSGDGLPYAAKGHYHTWFYFSVKGVQNGQTLTFNIRGMAAQGKLYKMGLRPVYRVSPNSMKWKRCQGPLSWNYEGNFQIKFSHTFSNFKAETDTAYFAWTYPYSFEQSLKHTQKLLRKYKAHEEIYIHREILYYSRERRPMEIITFSDKTKMMEEREALIEGLFPDAQGDPTTRPFRFDKPTIFISSRVHPGETPASFVLDGIWKFLTNEQSEQARILRERFVFKVVPMLNPDGVYRGYYRLDTLGQNLNRYYINPNKDAQPTIWAVRQAIKQQVDYKKICVYVDLHAHASKRACFMFGNNLQGEDALKAMLLPKLLSMNSLNFDFLECSFSDKMMKCKDKKDGLSREGCGRVSIGKLTGIPNCYTLECNYASGRTINRLTPKVIKATGQHEPEIAVTDTHSKFYEDCYSKGKLIKNKAPVYTIEIFEDVGRAFCIGLLDFYDCNPVSRLPSSNAKTLAAVEKDILSHYPIFIPKKKEEEKKELPPLGRPLRKTTSLQRPGNRPQGLPPSGSQGGKESREKGHIQSRSGVPSRMSNLRDSKKQMLLKTGSAVIQPKSGNVSLKNQNSDPSSKMTTQTTKPSLNSQSNQSSNLQQPKILKQTTPLQQLINDSNRQFGMIQEKQRPSPRNQFMLKKDTSSALAKKELPMGSCAFFMDPDPSSGQVSQGNGQNKVPDDNSAMLLNQMNQQQQPTRQKKLAPEFIIGGTQIDQSMVLEHQPVNEAKKALSDMRSRVGSLRSKIRTNLHGHDLQDQNSHGFQQVQSAHIHTLNDSQGVMNPSRYKVLGNRSQLGQDPNQTEYVQKQEGGSSTVHHQQLKLDIDSRNAQAIIARQTEYPIGVTSLESNQSGLIPHQRLSVTNQHRGKGKVAKSLRPNFLMSKDNKSNRDALRLHQIDYSSNYSLQNDQSIHMQKFRMATPTDVDPSKIMAGNELKGISKRHKGGMKSQQPTHHQAPKSIQSAQPMNGKKFSLEQQAQMHEQWNVSEVHHDSRIGKPAYDPNHSHFMLPHQAADVMRSESTNAGSLNAIKNARTRKTTTSRVEKGASMLSAGGHVPSKYDLSHGMMTAQSLEQQPHAYVHPFLQKNHNQNAMLLDDTTQATRDRKQLFKPDNLLPQITASAVGSLSQYQQQTLTAHQSAQRTHHSMNQAVKSEGGRSTKMKRTSLLSQHYQNQTNETNALNYHHQTSKGHLSSSQMSPDERNKIQELRRKISEATKSSHRGSGAMLGSNSSPKPVASPRLLDQQPKYGGMSSSRKMNMDPQAIYKGSAQLPTGNEII